MFRNILIVFTLIITSSLAHYVNETHTKPWRVRFYPKDSLFRKSQLIDRGCSIFLKECPRAYKEHIICARHYEGHYKTFNTYCEMEYENCNGWRQWSMIKRDRC